MDTNVLCYGDNLDIHRKYIPDESVDLVCQKVAKVVAPVDQATMFDGAR